MRRVSLLAMLLVLCSLAVPARAVRDEGILLRGDRTAYVDLYVYENTTIDTDTLRLTGGRAYVGFYMSPAPANRPTVGALVAPRGGATGGSAAERMQLGEAWEVQAGKYRVFLIADGPAEVFIPIQGQGFRGWNAKRRAPLSVRRLDFSVPAGSIGDTRAFPMTLKKRSLVIAAGQVSSSSLTGVDRLDACVTTDSGCSTTVALVARPPAARAWTYGVQLVMPGTYRGVLDLTRVGGVDAGSKVAGVVMVLTLGVQT
jgi:hypothetical protein